MTAAEAGASLTADSVDLIDEYNCRSDLLCLVEQVTHTACADTDIQLNKVRAGYRQKLHARLTGDRLCKQGLTCSRRAYEQYALGDACAHIGKRAGIFKKLHQLLKLFLFLVGTCDIGKGLLIFLLAAEAGPCLAELVDAAADTAAAVCLGHHDDPEHHQADQQYIGDKLYPPRRADRLDLVFLYNAVLVLLLYGIAEIIIKQREAVHIVGDLFCAVLCVCVLHLHDQLIARAVIHEGHDLLVNEQILDLGVGHLIRFLGGHECVDSAGYKHEYKNIKAYISGSISFGIQLITSS